MTFSVRLHGLPVGRIDRARNGGVLFQYDRQWLDTAPHPLSFSLPLETTRFSSARSAPFFEGLLPEARTVRRALSTYFGVEGDHDLLVVLGHDCPGAVTIHDLDDEVVHEDAVRPAYEILSDAELAEHIKDLPRRPLFVDADGELRLSLAGVNSKAAVVVAKDRIGLAKGRTPSTHILKIDIQDLEDSIKVENFCLRLAGRLGMTVPSSQIHRADGQDFMLIRRYDRRIVVTEDGPVVKRLHQEDFAQALGRVPGEKYEKDGGPNWKECFELMRRASRPLQARSELLARCLFQYLVGNPDAHAKNYSIIHRRSGMELAPLYDVNNAASFRHRYKRQEPRLAMSIAGERDPSSLTRTHWEDFASDIGMSSDYVLDTLSALSAAMPEAVSALRDEFRNSLEDSPLLDIVVEDVAERCRRTASELKAVPATMPGR